MILRRRLVLLLLPIFAAVSAPGAIIQLMIERIQASELVFSRADSNIPFVPAGWVETHSFGETVVNPGNLHYRETVFSQALFSPVWIGRRDIILAGEYAALQQIRFSAPQVSRHDVKTFMPMVAWVRQVSSQTQVGAFFAPQFTHGSSYAGREFEETDITTGALAIYWASDQWAWAYGGIALLGEYDSQVLPYLGVLWQPRPEWSVAFILPWPTVSYAPRKNLMFQAGLSPVGATLGTIDNGEKLRVGYDSFDLVFSVHRQVSKVLWLSAGVGWSGFGRFSIGGSDTQLKVGLDGSPVWTVRLALRPPKRSAPGPR